MTLVKTSRHRVVIATTPTADPYHVVGVYPDFTVAQAVALETASDHFDSFVAIEHDGLAYADPAMWHRYWVAGPPGWVSDQRAASTASMKQVDDARIARQAARQAKRKRGKKAVDQSWQTKTKGDDIAALVAATLAKRESNAWAD